jgi:hypothetical protein
MVNDMIMNKLNPEDKQYVIAHELAHVYLKHEQIPFNEKNKDFEQEADDLVRSWGSTPTSIISLTRRWLTEPRSANGMTLMTTRGWPTRRRSKRKSFDLQVRLPEVTLI